MTVLADARLGATDAMLTLRTAKTGAVSRISGYAKGHDTRCDQDCAKKAYPAVAFAQ